MQQTHVSLLASTHKFTPTDIKHLLPMHYNTATRNLETILTHYALHHHPPHLIIVPDHSLTLAGGNSGYDSCEAVWCDDFDGEPEHLRNCMVVGSAVVNYVGDLRGQPLERGWLSRGEVIAVRADGMDPARRRYEGLGGSAVLVGFRVLKHGARIYVLLGVNGEARDILATCCGVLRAWNLSRLKITSQECSPDLLHKICEHLFSMGRGFLREVNDDYNSYQTNLHHYLSSIAQHQLTMQLICPKFKQSKLQPSSVPHQATLTKWSLAFRPDARSLDLSALLSEVVTEWLLQTPLNASCSYATHLQQQAQTNCFILLTVSHYQCVSKPVYADWTKVYEAIVKVQALLFDQVFRRSEPEPHSLRTSMALLHKYQVPTDRNELDLSRQQTPKSDILNNSFTSLNESFITQYREGIGRQPSIKNIAKLEHQFYEILKHIDSRKPILSPRELEQTIRHYTRTLTKHGQTYPLLTEPEFQALQLLDAINLAVSPEDLFLLIKNNLVECSIFVPFFMQRDKYHRMVSVAKMLGAEHLEALYRESIKAGLTAHRNSIIPYYLKKMVQLYLPPLPVRPLKVDEISVPELVDLIESKNYNSHFYTSILSVIFPQLFANFEPAIRILSPIIYSYVQLLLKLDHHQELVMTFVGDLLYEVCYFTSEAKLTALSNAAYMEDRGSKLLSLKEKKVLEMLRQGGLKGYGYEVKKHLYPIIEANRSYLEPEQPVYHIITVEKLSQLLNCFKLLSSCHYTATINKIAKYLSAKKCYAQALSNNTAAVCFMLPSQRLHDFDFRESKQHADESQFGSIAERIMRSESGMFEEMVRLNPQVKIAGVELKSAMKEMTDSRVRPGHRTGIGKGAIDEEEAVRAYIDARTHQNYQYVELAWSIKDKYLKYPTLSESQKSYFRDCAGIVVEHKHEISQYIHLNNRLKRHAGGMAKTDAKTVIS